MDLKQRMWLPRWRVKRWGYKVERQAFYGAFSRCTNPQHVSFKHYGGRGIEFRFDTLIQFIAELGRRPEGKMLDRIDVDGHYEPGNVRWVTPQTSARNRRIMKTKKKRVRDRWQVALYVPPELKRKIKAAAAAEDRGSGPTILRILREHFAGMEDKQPPVEETHAAQ